MCSACEGGHLHLCHWRYRNMISNGICSTRISRGAPWSAQSSRSPISASYCDSTTQLVPTVWSHSSAVAPGMVRPSCSDQRPPFLLCRPPLLYRQSPRRTNATRPVEPVRTFFVLAGDLLGPGSRFLTSRIRPLVHSRGLPRACEKTFDSLRVATRPAARRPSGRWAAPLKASFPIDSNRSVPAVEVLATASAAPLSRSASEDKAARPKAAPKFILRTLNGNDVGTGRRKARFRK